MMNSVPSIPDSVRFSGLGGLKSLASHFDRPASLPRPHIPPAKLDSYNFLNYSTETKPASLNEPSTHYVFLKFSINAFYDSLK